MKLPWKKGQIGVGITLKKLRLHAPAMIGEDVDIPRPSRWWTPSWKTASTIFDTPITIHKREKRAGTEGRCLKPRYPRDRYILTNKLSPTVRKS